MFVFGTVQNLFNIYEYQKQITILKLTIYKNIKYLYPYYNSIISTSPSLLSKFQYES